MFIEWRNLSEFYVIASEFTSGGEDSAWPASKFQPAPPPSGLPHRRVGKKPAPPYEFSTWKIRSPSPKNLRPQDVNSVASLIENLLSNDHRNDLGIYQCAKWDRMFAQACDLRKHLLLHTGGKPHKCPNCEKAFARRYVLNYHITWIITSHLDIKACDVKALC